MIWQVRVIQAQVWRSLVLEDNVPIDQYSYSFAEVASPPQLEVSKEGCAVVGGC